MAENLGEFVYDTVSFYDDSPLEYEEIFKFIDLLAVKDVPLNRYGISNFGRVFDYEENTFLRPQLDKRNGYLYVSLKIMGNKVNYLVHHLVGFYFVPRKNEKYRILRHINQNKTDNYFTNLEWIRYRGQSSPMDLFKENEKSILNKREVELVCELLENRDLTQKDIAIASGIDKKIAHPSSCVSQIYCGRVWKGVSENYDLRKYPAYKKKRR